jgi:hypothetical protein
MNNFIKILFRVFFVFAVALLMNKSEKFQPVHASNVNQVVEEDSSSLINFPGHKNRIQTALDLQGFPSSAGFGFTQAADDLGIHRKQGSNVINSAANTWNALGSGVSIPGGIDPMVSEIEVAGSNVYVGGHFTEAGGIDIGQNIARWDGNTWHALGTGLGGMIERVVVIGPDVFVGGSFLGTPGDTNTKRIARWDGTSWNSLVRG